MCTEYNWLRLSVVVLLMFVTALLDDPDGQRSTRLPTSLTAPYVKTQDLT